MNREEAEALQRSHGVWIEPTVRGLRKILSSDSAEPTETLEQKTDRIIGEAERGMERLKHLLQSKLHLARSPQCAHALVQPFAFIEANKTNPYKNFEALKKGAEQQGIAPEALALAMPDPRHFTYSVVERRELDRQAVMIGTIAIRRSLAVRDRYDMSTAFNQFTIYHEMVHLMHHARQRARNLAEFMAFYANPEPRVIANEEFDAYGLEIEGMNVALDNGMRIAAGRNKALHPDVIMREFGGIGDDEYEFARGISLLAREYYRGGGDAVAGRYPDTYKDVVRGIVSHQGTVFEYGQPGVPTP